MNSLYTYDPLELIKNARMLLKEGLAAINDGYKYNKKSGDKAIPFSKFLSKREWMIYRASIVSIIQQLGLYSLYHNHIGELEDGNEEKIVKLGEEILTISEAFISGLF